MKHQVLQHLAALVAINTTNPPREISADGALVQYLKPCLESLGFQVHVSDYGGGHVNIFANRGTPDVLFNVHLDTVPAAAAWQRDPWQLSIEDERAYGLGACDIKGAAACLLSLAQELPQANMAMLFSTDEEGSGGCCIQNFCSEIGLVPYRQVVVAEPTQCEAVLAHRGYLSVVGRFKGLAGHSSEARALTESAVHRACHWAHDALTLAAAEQDIEQHGYRGVCFNLGRINGGVKSNVIADDAEVRWSARLRPGDDSDHWYQRFTDLDQSHHADWQRPFLGPPLPAREALLDAAAEFARSYGIPLAAGVNFWTEAALFSAAGVPALVLGPGDIRQAHSADEWVTLAQLELACERYQRIIEG